MKKENIIQSLKVITLGLMVAVGISYAFAWTPPTSTPPNGNVSAPINISGVSQTKTGFLWADGGLGSLGGGYFGGDLEVANGSGITLGGVKKTAWPSGGGSADWNSITNKPAGFADDVDDAGTQECVTQSKSATGYKPTGGSFTGTALCNSGLYMTGGACSRFDSLGLPSGNGWGCTVSGGAGAYVSVTVYSRCCK